MAKRMILWMAALIVCGVASAQERQTAREAYEAFRREALQNYDDFRRRSNEAYVEFVRQAWKEYEMGPVIPKPREEPVPPVTLPIEEREDPVESHPLPFDTIIPAPVVMPQPQPLEPVVVPPAPVRASFSFTFFGTRLQVPLASEERFVLESCDNDELADAWLSLSSGRYEALLAECLSIRERLHLCDWAYLLMLESLADAFLGADTNEASLLAGYLYAQSGYMMRLARQEERLHLLYASENRIYDQSYWDIDGKTFYSSGELSGRISVCPAFLPKERELSLVVAQVPEFDSRLSAPRTRVSERYPELEAAVSANENLIHFYETYPTSMVDADFGTRWAFYANVPASEEMRGQLYPRLRELLAGLSQQEAANRLLNWVQTGFVYQYDDQVWGEDRAFFPDESLYYPYCDCEDRSILFSRLVRDLMGLEAVLIYYPGHLATAVHFTETVAGDYLTVNGRHYVVCDPTYINAPVGMTMEGMDNSTAHVILLK